MMAFVVSLVQFWWVGIPLLIKLYLGTLIAYWHVISTHPSLNICYISYSYRKEPKPTAAEGVNKLISYFA
jgi:hypothetical protein